MNQEKNVLLLCLSTLSSSDLRVSEYVYDLDNKDKTVNGIMTNEAPAKGVIERLALKNKKLDQIVVICSDTVNKPIGERSPKDQDCLAKHSCIVKSKLAGYTHLELYKTLVNNYIAKKKFEDLYKNNPIAYDCIKIPDITSENEVSQVVVEAAEKVVDSNEDVNLYIDYNGGQRYIAFMILSLANLMEVRGVTIKDIMSMNYENKSNGKVVIQNMIPVYKSFDLVSGITEYVNYGRVKTLKNYFYSDYVHATIRDILQEMEKFTNNLQLCRTRYIMDHRNDLLKKLEDFIRDYNDKESPDIYEHLFKYVIEDILKGYQELLHGDLPDIIKWCVEKDFIQQAITFVSEEIPEFFWKKSLFRPSSVEELVFTEFLNQIRTESEARNIRKYYQPVDFPETNKAYKWMINYLGHARYQNHGNPMEKLHSDILKKVKDLGGPFEAISTLKFPSSQTCRNFIKKESNSCFPNIIELGSMIADRNLSKAKNDASSCVWHLKHNLVSGEQRRVETIVNEASKNRLSEIIVFYYLLKNQRNAVNHADDSTDSNDTWKYDDLRRALLSFTEILKDIY